MYECGDTVRSLFLFNSYQIAEVIVSRRDGSSDPFTIDSSEIVENGLNLDRAFTSGDSLEIATAIAA